VSSGSQTVIEQKNFAAYDSTERPSWSYLANWPR